MEQLTLSVDASCWVALLRAAGLWSLLDQKHREQWNRSVERAMSGGKEFPDAAPLPPLTLEGVCATLAELERQREGMAARLFIEWVESFSFHKEQALPVLLGRRLTIEHMYRPWVHGCNRWGVGRAERPLENLLNALEWVAGADQPKDHNELWIYTVSESMADAPWAPYFELKRFKNGKAKVVFHKHALGLVDKLNARMATLVPGALPAPR
nr:DUF4942 domain-containing protein [Stenotrophomonas maltophilia]